MPRRVSRWAPCGTKNSIEKSMLIYENYELSLPDSQPKSGKQSGVRGVLGGRGGTEEGVAHTFRAFTWKFLGTFCRFLLFVLFSFIILIFFFLGLFSLLYRSFLSGLPCPAVSPLRPRAPLASLLIVIINKSIQHIFHAQFVGHVTRHKPSSSVYFRAGFSFRAIYKLYLHTHKHTHTQTHKYTLVNCIV